MKYGELLAADGTGGPEEHRRHVHRFGADQIFQTDTYILKGEGVETWHSRFAYDGFRYVEVTGFPGRPEKDALTAVFFHSDVPVAGISSAPIPCLNRIWTAARWSYLSNLHGIPTDCPHREKNGWTGDAHLAAEQAMFNYFPAALYTKWINDLGDEQQPDGRLPGIVPTSGWGYTWGNGPAWDSALLLIPYYQYLYYGDTDILRAHYDGMKRYVDYLTGRAKNDIVSIGLNDWAPWKTKTEAGITDTAYYYVDATDRRPGGQFARQGPTMPADISRSGRRHQKVLQRKVLPARNRPVRQRRPDRAKLRTVSRARRTGEQGPRFEQSCRSGRKATTGTSTPASSGRSTCSIPCWKTAGPTWHTASWPKRPSRAGASGSNKARPRCGKAGAAADRKTTSCTATSWPGSTRPWPASIPTLPHPGFKHFIIKPNVVGDLTSAHGEYNSIRGKIVSDWKVADGQFIINLTIPANTTATVYLPIADAAQVREQDKPANNSPGITFLRTEDNRTVWTVASGVYRFSGPLQKDQ